MGFLGPHRYYLGQFHPCWELGEHLEQIVVFDEQENLCTRRQGAGNLTLRNPWIVFEPASSFLSIS